LTGAAPAAAACPACAMAQQEADSGMYRAGCQECAARMLAHGPEHFDAMSVAQFTPPYATALKRVFGADWMRGHERVRDWAKRIEALRQARGMKGAGA
jgi:hypothetical protein